MPGRLVWIYTAREDVKAADALRARGATITVLPDAAGQVDIRALLRDLGRRSVNELHLEAGPRLSGALVRAGLVDELLLYLAPLLLGSGARGPADWGPLQALSQGLALEFHNIARIGSDLRVLARVAGRGDF